ncbi:MAG: ribosome biogenesis GTPase Der, partial [Deltaproteobacteria bacterium]
MARPLIAIVGRPNVGKSTLFNRIVGRRAAIVEDRPGVTRDRNYAEAEWSGRVFDVVDTGGFEPHAEDEVRAGMRRQAQVAVEEAGAIVFVVDAVEGITSADEEVASFLRRSGVPVVVAANKVDSAKRLLESGALAEAHALGFEVLPISAEHGRGVGELLDHVLAQVRAPRGEAERAAEEDGVVRVAIIGRPNVGKSTLVNRLLGEERMVASELPGTTRDSIDARLRYRGRTYVLTDTAGIRRKKSIALAVERYSVVRAIRSIERSDVVVLLVDATEPMVAQDQRLASLAAEKGRGVVIAVNKWDQVRAERGADERLRARVRESLPMLWHVPVILLSALEGKRVFPVLEAAESADRDDPYFTSEEEKRKAVRAAF